MSLALWVGRKHFNVGTAAFLKAFFSTVYVLLERRDWGGLYPVVMRDFYVGRLPHQKAEDALRELQQIRAGLEQLGPEQVVWDFEDPSARPPWGNEISSDIKSMADYFVTSDGKNLLDGLGAAFEEARRAGKDVEIR